MANPLRVVFTSRDIDELVRRFSIRELRRELHLADLRAGHGRCFGDDALVLYFEEYGKAVERAMGVKLWLQRRDKTKLPKGKKLGRPEGSKDKQPRKRTGYLLRYANRGNREGTAGY